MSIKMQVQLQQLQRNRAAPAPLITMEMFISPLTANQATNHLQGGVSDVQGAIILNASTSERPDPDSFVLLQPAAVCSKNAN